MALRLGWYLGFNYPSQKGQRQSGYWKPLWPIRKLRLLKFELRHTLRHVTVLNDNYLHSKSVPCDLLPKCVYSRSRHYPGHDPTLELMAEIPCNNFLWNNWSHVSVPVHVSSILKVISWGQSFPVILWLLPFTVARAARCLHYATALEFSYQSVRLSLSQTALDCGHMDSASMHSLPSTLRGKEIWQQLSLKACKMFSRQKSRGKFRLGFAGDVQLLLLCTCWLFPMDTVLLYTSKLSSKPKKS